MEYAINENTTRKLVKYNKFKHKNNAWITACLIKSIKFRDEPHLKYKNPGISMEEHSNIIKTNIKTFYTIIQKVFVIQKSISKTIRNQLGV